MGLAGGTLSYKDQTDAESPGQVGAVLGGPGLFAGDRRKRQARRRHRRGGGNHRAGAGRTRRKAERERLAQSEAGFATTRPGCASSTCWAGKPRSSLDADAILAMTTRMVGEHLGVSICAYADMDADEDGFTIRGDWCAPGSPSIRGSLPPRRLRHAGSGELHAGQPLIINDNREELPPEAAATFQAIGISATICMPLVKEGRLTALMAIHDRAPRMDSQRTGADRRSDRTVLGAYRARRVVGVVRASENQFRTLAQAMPNHVWTAPPGWHARLVQQPGLRISGPSPARWTAGLGRHGPSRGYRPPRAALVRGAGHRRGL